MPCRVRPPRPRAQVTDAGVRQLSALTCLSRLVLRDTVEVSGDTLAVLLPALKELQVRPCVRVVGWGSHS